MKAKLFVILGLIALPIVATVAMSSHQAIPKVNVKTDIGKYFSDRVICLNIKNKLITDDITKSLPISVNCNKGVVTLSGFVANWKQKNRAAVLAKEVEGVTSVINKIIVRCIKDVPVKVSIPSPVKPAR